VYVPRLRARSTSGTGLACSPERAPKPGPGTCDATNATSYMWRCSSCYQESTLVGTSQNFGEPTSRPLCQIHGCWSTGRGDELRSVYPGLPLDRNLNANINPKNRLDPKIPASVEMLIPLGFLGIQLQYITGRPASSHRKCEKPRIIPITAISVESTGDPRARQYVPCTHRTIFPHLKPGSPSHTSSTLIAVLRKSEATLPPDSMARSNAPFQP
jgi:hypothetical protein